MARQRKTTSVSDQLKAAIRASDLSVYGVAKEAGMSPDPLYRFLQGERDLRLETASRICGALRLELQPIEPRHA